MTGGARGGRTVVVLGVPTALGGHAGGMERTPAALRELGLMARLAEALPEATVADAGDVRVEPGFRHDPDRRMKNHGAIVELLPRVTARVEEALAGAAPDRGLGAPTAASLRLVVIGGDCTAHAGALPGVRRALGDPPLGIIWFDAHGDFNTADTTPSGNVWGMPFAMICGRGDPDLVRAASGPSVDERHAALLGGQVLDEPESRTLAASPVAHFGAGMLATPGGMAALRGWAEAVARDVGGWYVAVDMDCLDGAGGWAVQMPEPDGLALGTVVEAVRAVAASAPVVAVGATGINLENGDPARTRDAVVAIARAAAEHTSGGAA